MNFNNTIDFFKFFSCKTVSGIAVFNRFTLQVKPGKVKKKYVGIIDIFFLNVAPVNSIEI